MRPIDGDKLKEKVLKWMPPDPCGKEEKEYPIETNMVASFLMEIDEAPTIEVSEDAISREYMLKLQREFHGWMPNDKSHELWLKIKNAPSVVPSRAEGEWIISADGESSCSVCGASEEEFICGTENWYGLGESKFCPSCGAKMKGADNE